MPGWGTVAKEHTDSELIRLSLGDPDVFAQVFTRHYRSVFGLAAAGLGRQAAEDVAGEVFLRAFANRHRFDPTYHSARPWLLGIASNLIQDHRRRTARQHRAYSRIAGELPTAGFEQDVAARVDAAASSSVLHEALGALRPEQAAVVLLYVTADHSYQDIADILEIPIGTVRSRLSRARQKLRNSLGPIDEQVRDDDE